MPNHFHGIIIIENYSIGARHAAPLLRNRKFGKPTPNSLPTIIRSFKSAATRQINILRQTPGQPIWQQNYWERVIRNNDELNLIREYIINNPTNLKSDMDIREHFTPPNK